MEASRRGAGAEAKNDDEREVHPRRTRRDTKAFFRRVPRHLVDHLTNLLCASKRIPRSYSAISKPSWSPFGSGAPTGERMAPPQEAWSGTTRGDLRAGSAFLAVRENKRG
jgi:hypothetical protein